MQKNFDVIIAGGGVIGASCAYYLSKRKDLSIALIDEKRPGNASRASAGGLWPIGESVGLGCGVIFFKMNSALRKQEAAHSAAIAVDATTPHILPDCFFDFALASNALYPQLHHDLVTKHNMDFKFEKTGLKYVIYDDDDQLYAEHIAAQIPHLAEHVHWLDQAQLIESEPYVSHQARGALVFTSDHQVNPYRLVDAYTEAARQNGVTILFNTPVTGVMHQNGRISGVKTPEETLGCQTLINAGGAWAAELCQWATGQTIPVYPVKGQIILTEKLPKLLRGCITTSDCYLAQKDNGEILIGSTTEEKGYNVEITYPEINGLVQGAIRCLPQLEQASIKRCWAGLRPGTPDELPILGPMDGVEGYLNACGHFRTGILTSAITGVMLDKLVHHETLPVDIEPFLASRFVQQQEPQLV